jgi:hypothetical protein
MIEPRLHNFYAQINVTTGKCKGVQRTTDVINNPAMIPIPVYDENYIGKYYINGNWYEDAEGTIPWTSSLL